jgi:hypothetical protein
MTTTATPPDTQTLSLVRPEGVSDARWDSMQTMAHLVVTGHYPWCTDHEGEPFDPDGWCRREMKSRVSEVTLSNGTLSGAPVVVVVEALGSASWSSASTRQPASPMTSRRLPSSALGSTWTETLSERRSRPGAGPRGKPVGGARGRVPAPRARTAPDSLPHGL